MAGGQLLSPDCDDASVPALLSEGPQLPEMITPGPNPPQMSALPIPAGATPDSAVATVAAATAATGARLIAKMVFRGRRRCQPDRRIALSVYAIHFAARRSPPTVNRGKTPPTEPLTGRERRVMVIATGVVAAAIAVGAAAWALTTHERSEDGCVNVSIASSMGGAVEHACGAAARDWCHAASVQHDAHALAVQAQCRAAGILP